MATWKEQFWWFVPMLGCVLGSIIYLSYNLFPSTITYSLRGYVVVISFICLLLLPVFWLIVSVVYGLNLGFGGKPIPKRFTHFVASTMAFGITACFISFLIIRPINTWRPPPQLTPSMQVNEFSRTLWKSQKSERIKMVGDLVDSVLLNKNCSQTEVLLGPSLDENFGNSLNPLQCSIGHVSELRYFLGSNGFLGDIANLQIFFDETGIYSHYQIYSYSF